jgi:hypothetical protein
MHVQDCQRPNPEVLEQEPQPLKEPVTFPRQLSENLSHPASPIPGVGIRRPSFQPAASSRPSPPDLNKFPVIDENNYIRAPEPTTITTHPTIALRAYSIVINVDHGGLIICLNCGCCMTSKDAYRHIKHHFPALDVP